MGTALLALDCQSYRALLWSCRQFPLCCLGTGTADWRCGPSTLGGWVDPKGMPMPRSNSFPVSELALARPCGLQSEVRDAPLPGGAGNTPRDPALAIRLVFDCDAALHPPWPGRALIVERIESGALA